MTDLTRGLPPSLLEGDSYAIACDVADELLHLFNAGDLTSLYMRIDELDENILDILAYDFKIDWWDAEYTLEEKRKVMASSWEVHRHLGTIGAVLTAIRTLYPDATVTEWFDYNGLPFHFKVSFSEDGTFANDDKQKRVVDRVMFYKNLRSVFDAMEVFVSVRVNIFTGVALRLFNKVIMSLESLSVRLVDENWNALLDEEGNQLI